MILMDIIVTPTKTLTPSEENFLNIFMNALYKINPSLHEKSIPHEKDGYIYMDPGMGCIFQCQEYS